MRIATRIIARLVGVAVMLVVLGLVGLFAVLPRVSGATALNVLSGSMEPTIPVGSAVFIRPVDPMTVEVGDVITFQAAPGVRELITHRVVEVQHKTQPQSFITKGDNNRGEDLEPVPVGAVRGEVWFHVPYLGRAADVAKGPATLGVLLLLGGALVLSYLVGLLRTRTAAPEPETVAEPVGSESP